MRPLLPLFLVVVTACSSGSSRSAESARASTPTPAPGCATTCRPALINQSRVADELRDAQSSLRTGGTVLINILIDETGVPQDVVVATSSGNVRVDAVAVDMGRVMRFSPAVENGVATMAWVQMPIQFRME